MSRILTGDVREMLKAMPDESVHCCVTSPPYWGLRDYGTAAWEGGAAECDHKREVAFSEKALAKSTISPAANTGHAQEPFKESCGKCGARRIDSQLGLEATPDEYVANMIAVFRDVRRVLRADGTLWLNLGDSYAANRSYQVTDNKHTDVGNNSAMQVPAGLKPKDLVGIPWRVAFALQSDGWWLRSDIIWSKPNPMPESVTDRPTKAHEYVFLLSKSARYYYNAEAIKEPDAGHNGTRPFRAETEGVILGRATFPHGGLSTEWESGWGRNKRSVWTVATQPYSEAHFATFPEELVKPCILAGCPEGGGVLDPFFGSGTTGVVAKRAGRDYIGIELNPEYVAMAEKRIGTQERLL